jgi:DNA replication licensing factor MCM5
MRQPFLPLYSIGWIVILIFFRFSRCGPRLSEASAEKLKNRYVLMRSGVREHEMETEKRLNIPITVR